MWEEVGITRDAGGLKRAIDGLETLDAELDAIGVADDGLAFNLTWHDWLNLKNLILVSRAIAAAALAREDSRGAHYRADFPDVRDLARSSYTCVNWRDGRFDVATRAVEFTRVKPGKSLLKEVAAA
jgi:fumarate reductase flavoprotein subunit